MRYILLMLIASSAVWAQEPAAAKPDESVKMTTMESLEYRKLTLEQAAIQNQIDLLIVANPEIQKLIEERNAVAGKLATFQEQLFKSHGKNQEEWAFSPQTGELVRKTPAKPGAN